MWPDRIEQSLKGPNNYFVLKIPLNKNIAEQ
jgi:hypothetical protein